MQIFPKYVFFGGAFGLALVAVALASTGEVDDGSVVFLSQNDTSKYTVAELGPYQQLNCEDIQYDIVKADLVLSGAELSETQDLQLTFGTVSGKGEWDALKKREVGSSATVKFSSGEQRVVTFTFDPPVLSSDLCRNVDDMAYMKLKGVNASGILLYGSERDAYAGPLYSCVLENGLPCTGTIIDVAFSLYTLPNDPPVIEDMSAQTVKELETVTFTLKATDPNGDSVTWGSGNLPEGATLDETTGEFSWTPTSDQVQDYKVTFTATDDGGPVQETSSVTVFISVVDVETTIEAHETLVDTVLSLELEKNVENSYLANLKNVETFLEKGQDEAAKNQLDVFKAKVEQDLKKGLITQEEADFLIEEVQVMIEKI